MFYFYSSLNDEDANREKGERRTGTPQTLEGWWCSLPSIKPNPVVVRSVRRRAAYQARWSTRRQPLLLDDFALAAEK
jgi:hypothetical protein